MCLEQTINRSSKGKGGVIEVTKRTFCLDVEFDIPRNACRQ